jgi:cell growth-regulating nucleolar protein
MVSFVCDNCGDTMTKPKVKNHLMRPRFLSSFFNSYFYSYRCSRSSFSCIDCYTRFSHDTVHQHTQCITEAQKHHGQYADGKNRAGNDKPKNTNNSNSSPSTPKNEKKQEEKKEVFIRVTPLFIFIILLFIFD